MTIKTFLLICGAIFVMWLLVGIPHPESQTSFSATPAQSVVPDPNEIAFQSAVQGAKALKEAMRDPDSFKLTQALIMPGGAACYEYRSRNGFGGMNAGEAVLSLDGTIRSNEMAGFYAAWKRTCAGKSGQDKTWEVGLAAGFHGMFSDQ